MDDTGVFRKEGGAGAERSVTPDTEAFVRVRRIELLPDAWEASILPLNYTRSRMKCTLSELH